MDIEDAWNLHLSPCGRSVETRNRLAVMLLDECCRLVKKRIKKFCEDTVRSEIGLYLIGAIDAAKDRLTGDDLVEVYFVNRLMSAQSGRRMESDETRVNLSGQANTRAKAVDRMAMYQEPVATGSVAYGMSLKKSHGIRKGAR